MGSHLHRSGAWLTTALVGCSPPRDEDYATFRALWREYRQRGSKKVQRTSAR